MAAGDCPPGDAREFSAWRLHLAERIASHIDPARFGVKAVYLLGSAKAWTAGPSSDIDLLVLFDGTPAQREQLALWLEGWSLCLDEVNALRTGRRTGGLLDVHVITEDDIASRTSYAVKIGSPTDPARRLPLGEASRTT